eukprot:226025_1
MSTSNIIFFGLFSMITCGFQPNSKPNIIFMFADDLGFNELGYHGCTETATPFINDLAIKESLILLNNYVEKVCSPSRASFLTGRYPSNLGIQNLVFNPQFPASLTRQVSTLSNEFKHSGYSTHIIGKWHLGYQSWEYTPTYRGFDTFAGFYGGWQTYYSHQQHILGPDGEDVNYYDLRENEQECEDAIDDEIYGVFWERDHAIDLLSTLKHSKRPWFFYLAWQASHTPDEAPKEYVDMYKREKTHPHRIFSQAQTTVLDDCINDVVTYLKDNNMWENTLLVFSSDNGGDYDRGDNYPLRGYKNSSWEGGIRVPGFVSGGFLQQNRRGKILDNVIVHVTDWYKTLLSAAGIEPQYITSKKLYNTMDTDIRFENNGVGKIEIDGKDIWHAIQYNEINNEISIESREVLLDLNQQWCEFSSCGAIRIGKWKFLRGNNIGTNDDIPDDDQWQRVFATCINKNGHEIKDNILGCDEYVDSNSIGCHLNENGCLFDIENDPCEYTNLVDEYMDVAKQMIHRLDFYNHKAIKPLITMDNQLSFDDIDPNVVCDSEFWCPFMSYKDVEFEKIVTNKYKEVYAIPDEKQDNVDIMVVLLIVFALIGIFCVVYVNMNHFKNMSVWNSKIMTDLNNLRNETAPLM